MYFKQIQTPGLGCFSYVLGCPAARACVVVDPRRDIDCYLEIARDEGYAQGIVPLHTLRSDIDYACEEAHTTYGKLGVKVWICRGEVLPGQMVKEPEAAPASARMGGHRGPRRDDRRGGYSQNRAPRSSARPAEAAAAAPAAAPAENGGTK